MGGVAGIDLIDAPHMIIMAADESKWCHFPDDRRFVISVFHSICIRDERGFAGLWLT